MNTVESNLNNLFAQLGLDDTDQNVTDFIRDHSPLPGAVKLADAAFWTKSQADFLSEAVALDADWAIVVEQLDALLRTDDH